MKMIPLYDPTTGMCSPEGIHPPLFTAVIFQILDGQTKIGVTGQLACPALDKYGVTNSGVVFIEMDASHRQIKTYLVTEVAAWLSCCEDEYNWASASELEILSQHLPAVVTLDADDEPGDFDD